MTEKETTALQAYSKGCTCSQAVISAYLDELGIDREKAYRLMEGFGGGFGGMQEVCGAFSAACAVISFLSSDGSENASTKLDTYGHIRKAGDEFSKIYGSLRCIEILNGNKPKPFSCGKKVRDAVILIENYIKSKTE